MNKDLEKQIEEAAKLCPFIQLNNCSTIDEQVVGIQSAIWGIESEAAQKYWQQGMYTEEEVKEFNFQILSAIITAYGEFVNGIASNPN